MLLTLPSRDDEPVVQPGCRIITTILQLFTAILLSSCYDHNNHSMLYERKEAHYDEQI